MNQRKEGNEERKEGIKAGTPTSSADTPIGLSRSEVLNARNRGKHGRWCGVSSPQEGKMELGISSILSR